MSIKDELVFKKFSVLDDGFVTLVDSMGDDSSIVQAARVSYGAGTKSVSDDETLIRYLMRHYHETPCEMANIKILVRCPIVVFRQWVRHRVFSFNEYSGRYSEMIDSMLTTKPDEWRLQSTSNKQGSAGTLINERITTLLNPGKYLTDREKDLHELSTEIYQERLKFGVAREQARKDLPLGNYTEVYCSTNLRGWLSFLLLRMDSHAQQEIREYANIIGHQIVAKLFPITWQAFLDYRINSITFSSVELRALRKLLIDEGYRSDPNESLLTIDRILPQGMPSEWKDKKHCRERDEFISKFNNILSNSVYENL